ncbi:hypothetical protein LWC35_03255 [Pseudonocardia kujensis]|uniref:DUF7064 domain-containing protein n=1 Tax=Pseudonocardia kujensis TaxID=1128675 RepID=UPI001E6462BC|nr:hypothetical protein [Pseudonocardia kujensis]MCE0761934.1 hypothetical protein [Pseudonocardia kujensis]
MAVDETRHALTPGGHDRESLVWAVPLPEEKTTVVVYTWVNGDDVAGAAAMVFGSAVGDQVFEVVDGVDVGRADFADWAVGPLHLALRADGSSSVRFAGEQAQIELEFVGTHEAYPYSEHVEGCPGFFADDRVEQTGRVTGRANIGGRTVEFAAAGQRDHSWGTRDWAAMTHMKWLNVVTDVDTVHLVELQAFGRTHLRGYLVRDGELSPLATAHLVPAFDPDLYYRSVTGTVTDRRGRTVELALDADPHHFTWQVHPRLRIHDSMLAGTANGLPAAAYADASWETCYVEYHQARSADRAASGRHDH